MIKSLSVFKSSSGAAPTAPTHPLLFLANRSLNEARSITMR
jgi:hypothetical protein